MIQTHTFRGTKYDVDITGDIEGRTDDPRGGRPTLLICTDITTKKGLETIIHESLHACSFLKSEDAVGQTAYDIARLLWRIGFRCKAK